MFVRPSFIPKLTDKMKETKALWEFDKVKLEKAKNKNKEIKKERLRLIQLTKKKFSITNYQSSNLSPPKMLDEKKQAKEEQENSLYESSFEAKSKDKKCLLF